MRAATRLAYACLLCAACSPDPSPAVRAAVRGLQRVEPISAAGATPEAAARGWLATQLDGVDLVLQHTRHGLAGTYLRFAQRVAGLEVFDAEVIVLVDPSLRVRAANLQQRDVAVPSGADVIGETGAVHAALAAAGPGARGFGAKLGIDRDGRLAWRVRASGNGGDFLTTVDAQSGAVRERRDLRRYADGAGYVYDPNPVASTGNNNLVDNGDATSAALNAARIMVTLPRLDGTGRLFGTWVDSRPKTVNKRAVVASLQFFYDRSDNQGHFEETNAYYHIDRTQARIQALGFTDVNNRRQVANVNDFNRDNSFYNPMDKEISYGVGGVDDAEDADVIVHEYGHSIQDDQVPDFGSGGDAGSMGEGFGDYMAAAFGLTLAAQVGDPFCIAEWDATSYSNTTPPCLRRLDTTKHWPELAANEVHDDGEMWSAALFKARGLVGADIMDKLVLEAHFMLATDASFQQASDAILEADHVLYADAHRATLRRTFVAQGLSRELSTAANLTDLLSSETVAIENPRTNMLYANHLDDTQTYTASGAEVAAVRLHFTRIDTQVNAACLDGGCDNIYLYDANGDLYQILNGHQDDILSVQIPGNEVRIRLVTDGTTTDFGYTIDRVDLYKLPAPPDASVPDAAVRDADLPDVVTSMPDAPLPMPDAPATTPDAPAATPDAPEATPDAPAATPDAPAATPDAPAATPDAPASTPDAPASTPDASASTPDAPAATPDAAAATPDAATPAPDAATPRDAAAATDAVVAADARGGMDAPPASGSAEGGGCDCRTGTSGGDRGSSAILLALAFAARLLPRRRRR